MKLKKDFMLRKLGDQNVVVAFGEASRTFNGIIRLNDTAAFMWSCLVEDITLDQLVDAVAENYSIDRELAEKDADAFVSKLKKAGLFENE